MPTVGEPVTEAGASAAPFERCATGKRPKPMWVALLVVLTLAGISIAATTADAATRAKAPVARDDLYTVEEDGRLTIAAPGVLLNDKANGGKLTVKSFSAPGHGDLDLARNGSLVYTPDENYAGEDSFTYTARNKWRKTDKARVGITANPVNDAPRITAPDTLPLDASPAALTGIGVADVDAGAGTTTLAFSVGSDSLTAENGDGVTVSGSGTGTLTLSGTVAAIDAYVAGSNVTFTAPQDATSVIPLQLTLGDGGNTGSGGTKTDSKTVDIDLAPLSSAQIAAVRGAADGPVDLPIRSALVTYKKPSVSTDPAGFFVQAERDGPAVFVAVDPATLTPSPAAGDVVSLTVTGKSTVDGMARATGVSSLAIHSRNNPVAPLLADVSAVADLPSVLGSYESEYVSVSGTLTSGFSSAGTGYSSAALATSGTPGSSNLRLRAANAVLDQIDLVQGCSLTATAPLWRFNAQAQPSAWSAEDLTGVSCPAPKVTRALATSSTAVTVSFDRRIDPSSVAPDGSQFTFDNGLAATGATVTGREVRLTTGNQTAGADYTVTVASSVKDILGAGVSAGNTAGFTGFDPAAVLRINEIAPNVASERDLVEFVAVQGGNTEGLKLLQGTSELATLPEARVVTGDVIVLHLNPATQNGDAPASETLAKAQFPNATYSANYDTAWDFHGGISSVNYSNQVLRVRDAGGATQDALAVARSGFTTSTFPAQLQALQAEGLWQPSDCGGAPCTYASLPTAQDVSADWSGLPTTRITTLYRISGQDSDQRGDWTVGPHSLGLSNP